MLKGIWNWVIKNTREATFPLTIVRHTKNFQQTKFKESTVHEKDH